MYYTYVEMADKFSKWLVIPVHCRCKNVHCKFAEDTVESKKKLIKVKKD